jgi:hypothetical protein
VKTRVFIFSPFSINTYVSHDLFAISKVHFGLVGARYIITFCKVLT